MVAVPGSPSVNENVNSSEETRDLDDENDIEDDEDDDDRNDERLALLSPNFSTGRPRNANEEVVENHNIRSFDSAVAG